PRSDEPASTVWVSAFCALMQLRGNRILAEPALAASVRRAIDYFLATQEDDGRWVDPRWADLDTTSHPVSFFNVVLALGEGHRRAEVERAWRRGLAFILERQTAEGGWHDADFHPSGVEITAHLIQDALVADLVLGERVPGIRDACRRGLACLRSWQAADGSWDEENVDHTMDSVRSSMVVSRILGDDPATTAAIERGLAWILRHKNAHGWGDFPGMETNLERTCDGIDTLCKYRAFVGPDPRAVVRLWGYVPGGGRRLGPGCAARGARRARPGGRQGGHDGSRAGDRRRSPLCHPGSLPAPRRAARARLRRGRPGDPLSHARLALRPRNRRLRPPGARHGLPGAGRERADLDPPVSTPYPADRFVDRLVAAGIDFFTGVPCSLVASVIAELERRGLYHGETREDAALGVAAGAYLGGRLPMVVMQNSGLGVSLNALGSLHILYRVPVLLLVTWRGYAGADAPEHVVMGAVLPRLLDLF